MKTAFHPSRVKIPFHKKLLIVLTALMCTGAPTTSYAVDASEDGLDDLYIYYPDTQRVEAYTLKGESVTSFPLDAQLIGKVPLVFPGLYAGEPVLYSIASRGGQSILYKINSEGEVNSQLIGNLSQSAVMLFDLDGNNSADFTDINRNGTITTRFNVFQSDERTVRMIIPRIKRKTKITITRIEGEPYLVAYTYAKRKRKTVFQSYSLTSSKQRTFSLKKRVKSQLFPYNLSHTNNGELIGIKPKKSGKITSVDHLTLSTQTLQKQSIPASRIVIPGTYSSAASPFQIFSVSTTGLLISGLQERLSLLSELDLSEATARSGALLSQPFYPYLRKKAQSTSETCTYTEDGNDGAGGFLLKASDKDGRLVVLLPYQISTAYTELITYQGKSIEKLTFSGRSNGFRETHRASKLPTSYPKELIVRAVLSNAQSICYKISNSHVRND